MRRILTWLVTLPLSLSGVELGHALINSIVGSPTGSRGELFEAGGPGAGLVPWFSAVALALIVLGLAARIAGWWPQTSSGRGSPIPYGLVAPVAFIVQEHLETFLHSGSLSISTIEEPTFFPGLALQVPFALAAYLAARFLLRVADGVRAAIGRAPALRVAIGSAVARIAAYQLQPHRSRLSSACSGRAPPVAVPAMR